MVDRQRGNVTAVLKPAPRLGRRRDLVVLDHFGRPISRQVERNVARSLPRPWVWIPRREIIDPRSMPYPGVMPQMPPGAPAAAHASVSFVKVQIATSNSVGTITSIAAGDFVVQLAYRNNSTTPPTRATDWLTPPGTAENGADSMAVTIGYRYATGTSLAGGTWTNATATIALVYRNVHPTAPFGLGFVPKTATTPPVVIDPLLMAVGDGSSWVITFMNQRNTSNNFTPTTMGLTQRNGPVSSGTYSVQGGDTNGGVSAFAGANSGTGITGSNRWQNYTAELLAAVVYRSAAEKQTINIKTRTTWLPCWKFSAR
jgi:hypothetical protein